jgi:tetratricopeptide (TPR) repeat protein
MAAVATASQPSNWDLELQNGRNAARAGRVADAEQFYRNAIAIAEQAGEPGRIANSITHLAILLRDRERYPEAAPLFHRALSIYRSTHDEPNTARALNNLASLKQVIGELAEAEKLFAEAYDLADRLGHDDEGSLVSATNLATIISARGDFTGALRILESARAKAVATGPESSTPAGFLNQLGILYRKLGRFADAEPPLKRALELRSLALGPDHYETAIVENNLGDLYAAQGRFKEAEPLLKRAAATCRARLAGSARCASMLNNLGSLKQHTGRWGEAETYFQDAIDLTAKSNVSAHAAALNNLAKLYVAENRPRDARALYERALAAWESAGAANHPDYASTLTNLGNLYLASKDFDQASSLMKRALDIDEKYLGATHWKVALDLNNLGALETRRKRYPEAEALLRRAVSIEERMQPLSAELARELANLGEVLARQKKMDEAAERYGQAIAIWEQRGDADPVTQLVLFDRYEQILRTLNEYAKAETVAARSMKIRVKSALEKSFR